MYYRKLGNTGFLTGEIGFSAWSPGTVPSDDDTAVAMIRYSIDHGANLIDVAAADGDGRGERLVGRAIEGRREQALVATRAGFVRRDGLLERDERDFGSEQISRAVHESLERLRCGYIDLLQLDQPSIEALHDEGLWEGLAQLQSDGVIRHIGVIAAQLDLALAALQDSRVETLQIGLNALDDSMLPVLDQARAAGVGVIARAPLLGGLLSGTDKQIREEHPILTSPLDDARAADELLQRFSRLVQDSGRTLAQMALGWVLAHEEVSVTIPGARNLAQLEANIATSDLPLPSPRQMAAIQHLQLTAAVP